MNKGCGGPAGVFVMGFISGVGDDVLKAVSRTALFVLWIKSCFIASKTVQFVGKHK